MKKIISSFFFIFTLLLFNTSLYGQQEEKFALTIPSFDKALLPFIKELLELSFHKAGVNLTLTILPDNIKTARFLNLMESSTDTTVHWLIETEERNQKYQAIPIPLTNGLIGQRILLIPKGEQARFDSIKTLQDFREKKLTAALSSTWFDVDLFKKNELPFFSKEGSWDPELFLMVSSKNRGVDYFPRGVNEILSDVKMEKSKNLEIEKKLVLLYKKDFIFYLSKKTPHEKHQLFEKVLSSAQKSGLITKLIHKHFKSEMKLLKKRVVLSLSL